MNRRMFFVAVLLVLVATPSFAFLTNYAYQRTFTLAGNVTVAKLDTQALITAGKMKSDCADLRVTDTSDNEYEYWVQYCNTTKTRVYARPTSSTETDHYIYYGYASATDISNFNATFSNPEILNGDFEAETVGNNPDAWILTEGGVDGSIDISSTQAYIGTQSMKIVDTSGGGGDYPVAYRTFENPVTGTYVFEFEQYINDISGGGIFMAIRDSTLTLINIFGPELNFTWYNFESNTVTYMNVTVSAGSWYSVSVEVNTTSDKQKFWINGSYAGEFDSRYGAYPDIGAVNFEFSSLGIGTYYIDAVRIFKFVTYAVLGAETPESDLTFSIVPVYPLVDDSIVFTANWTIISVTDLWWNFSATNQSFHTLDIATTFAGYATSGQKNVTLITNNAGTNISYSAFVTIYDNLTGVTIGISSFLPFIANEPTITINYTSIGGTPIVNSTWTFTLPDTTTNTSVVNQSSFTYILTQSDVHMVSVTVCDLGNSVCISNTSQFKPWNITGGVNLHTPFNDTSNSLSTVFYGDAITFISTGELTWGLAGTTKVGTATTWEFDSSNNFWSDDNYLHHKITVNNSWGVYVSNQSFTVVTALYNLSVGCTDFRVPYCFINADIYDLSTSPATQITDSGNTFDYFLTLLSGEGHANETNDLETSASLNLSLCLNATPLIDSFTLDGIIGYGATNYTTTSYAFDSAEMDFVTSCSFDNGHKFNLYLLPNSTKTYATTFTFLQGGTPLEDALVKIQATLGSNWITISSGVTDVNGKVTFPLEQCFTWYKIIVENSGEVLYQSEVTCLAATECTTTTCSRIIPIDTVPQEWFSVMDGIASNCVYSEVLNYLRCTVTDTSGKGVSATLTLARLLGGDVVCTESETSTTTTLICETGGFYPGAYKYLVEVNTDGTTYPIQSGGFTIGTPTTMGEEGPIVALAILLTLVFAVSKTHPVILIIVSGFAFVLISTLKLITFGYATTGWIIAMAGVALVRAMTKGA